MKRFLSILLSINFIMMPIQPETVFSGTAADCEILISAYPDRTEVPLADYCGELLELYDTFDRGQEWDVSDSVADGADWEREYQTARILVKSEYAVSDERAVACAGPHEDCYVLQYESAAEAKDACEQFARDARVVYALPDAVYELYGGQMQPATTAAELENMRRNGDWGREACNFSAMRDAIREKGEESAGQEVIVAAIDTGITVSHEIFAGRLTDVGFNTILPGSAITDDDNEGHGTAVASIIAMNTPSNVKILPVKAFDSAGRTKTSAVRLAIECAVEKGAGVINMSFGGPKSSQDKALEDAVSAAQKAGVLIIGAYGNDGVKSTNVYPACYSGVIGVSAVTRNETLASFSNYGEKVDICAPGEKVFMAGKSSSTSYALGSGTSFSAPYIAAGAALALCLHPEYDADKIAAFLYRNTKDLGTAGKDIYYGNGILCFDSEKIGKALGSFRVSFAVNGGTAVAAQTAAFGSLVKLPEVERKGYHLEGWYYDPYFTVKVDPQNCVVSDDMTLYARWQKHSFIDKKKKILKKATYLQDGSACYLCDVCKKEGEPFAVSRLALAAPKSLSVSAAEGGLKLKWKKTEGAEGYYIFRKYKTSASYQKIATIRKPKTTAYLDRKVKEKKQAVYAVCAFNKVQKSKKKKSGTVCYLKKTAFTKSEGKTGGIRLQWKKNKACSGYQIERSSSGSASSVKYAAAGQKDQIRISNLSKKTVYYFRIRAYVSINGRKYYSAWSRSISVKTK